MKHLPFCRFELRTTDIVAARAFYESILEAGCPDISLLPDVAIARGAKPHWLGHIGAADSGEAERLVGAFLERGAMQLGPTRTSPDGNPVVALRDPGGALLAICVALPTPPRGDAIWHQLHTNNLSQAKTNYRELLGWHLTEQVAVDPFGVHQMFAYAAGGPDVGSMADVAGQTQIHTQWLHYFRVANLDHAVAKVRSAGGLVIGPFTLPSGVRVAPCDDPQTGAFGLMQPA